MIETVTTWEAKVKAGIKPAIKTGELKSIGFWNHGLDRYHYYECVDCGTEYPVINGHIRCNGKNITHCPFCCQK